MTQQKYIWDRNQEYIVGVENEKYVTAGDFKISNYNFVVFVTREKDYYNVYIIDDFFKKEPLNNLKEQIPVEVVPVSNYFTEELLEKYAIEHYLWYKYDKTFNIEEVSN